MPEIKMCEKCKIRKEIGMFRRQKDYVAVFWSVQGFGKRIYLRVWNLVEWSD